MKKEFTALTAARLWCETPAVDSSHVVFALYGQQDVII